MLIARADADGWNHGVRIIALQTYRRRLTRMSLGVLRAFRLAWRARADVYHIHDPELMPVVVALRLMGKAVVYDAHEWLSKQVDAKPYLPPSTRAAARTVARAIEWSADTFASRVVTVNEACAEIYRPDKVTIVANFPDNLGTFSAPEASSGPVDAGPRFVYVGGISRVRGVVEQVDAIAELNRTDSARFTLLGAFDGAALEQEVSQQPGWSYVDYLGPTPHAEVAGHLAGAIAGLATLLPTPNHLISSPVKVFEYMASGLPVILSDFPAWRRMLDGADCALFVDPGDPAAIAGAMRWLIHHPDRAAEMGAAARIAVDERFNWTTQLDNLVGAYRVLGAAPA
jgi:glycosyltransferase involved in cell wall biosynthesis